MRFINTLNQHLENPSESVDAYLQRRSLDLAQQITPAKKVYLDTNFWVQLSNVQLGRSVKASDKKLMQVLEDLASRHLIVCPISAATFAEIFRQTDSRTLRATLEIVDNLSQGIALLDPDERVRLELFHFVRRLTHGVEALHSTDDLVWTKVGYVLGFTSPSIARIPPDIDAALQKAFIDQMWDVNLTEMLDVLGTNATSMPRLHDYSEKLNRGKFAHLNDHSAFAGLFLAELSGALDAYEPILSDLMSHLASSSKQANVDDRVTQTTGNLASIIYQAFRSNQITTELPSFRVNAAMHAAVRWDFKRKYKANDAHDFHHAVAALPYCDYFLTEGSLRSLVNQKNLGFSTFFRCRTFSDSSDAILALNQISRTN